MCVKNASKKSCGKTSYQKKHHTFSKHFNWSSWGAKNFCWIHRFLTENAPWTCAWAADHGCILRIPWPRTSCGGIYRRRLPLTFDASGSWGRNRIAPYHQGLVYLGCWKKWRFRGLEKNHSKNYIRWLAILNKEPFEEVNMFWSFSQPVILLFRDVYCFLFGGEKKRGPGYLLFGG